MPLLLESKIRNLVTKMASAMKNIPLYNPELERFDSRRLKGYMYMDFPPVLQQ